MWLSSGWIVGTGRPVICDLMIACRSSAMPSAWRAFSSSRMLFLPLKVRSGQASLAAMRATTPGVFLSRSYCAALQMSNSLGVALYCAG
jgi:hypothetical protein